MIRPSRIINVFMGLSVGANVVIAHFYGANSKSDVFETVHTAIAMAGVCGVFLLVLGFFVSEPALIMMDTPAEILPYSTRYMQVYFIGVPMMLLYNFGAAIPMRLITLRPTRSVPTALMPKATSCICL